MWCGSMRQRQLKGSPPIAKDQRWRRTGTVGWPENAILESRSAVLAVTDADRAGTGPDPTTLGRQAWIMEKVMMVWVRCQLASGPEHHSSTD